MFTIGELTTVVKVIMKSSPPTAADATSWGNSAGVGAGFAASSHPPSVVSDCFTNCSGHGLCHQGECWCEVQFRGATCQATNFVYYTVFSCLFFLLSIVSLVQLAVCLQAEYHKQQKPSLRDVLRVTNQKLVYLFVTMATASRGLYFAIQLSHPVISFNLQTVYYPLILTIFSLIVCLWAESFHINGLYSNNPSSNGGGGAEQPTSNNNCHQHHHPSQSQLLQPQSSSSSGKHQTSNGTAPISPSSLSSLSPHCHSNSGTNSQQTAAYRSFLTKSLGPFITFNVSMYILLFVQLLATNTWVKDIAGKKYWMRISKACFASLTLLIVVFFLIYGVEMFFKVRGAFVDTNRRLNPFVACSSRLSLIAQGACLLFLALFLFSDVAFIHFDQKITDLGVSYFDTACRAVDLCVAIWFPLVLWKSAKPDELWLLNPKFLFHKQSSAVAPEVVTVYSSKKSLLDSPNSAPPRGDYNRYQPIAECPDESLLNHNPSSNIENSQETNLSSSSSITQECFICYDSERDDAGPLINPCKCKGDTSVVHHDCLRRWILESLGGYSNDDHYDEVITPQPQSSSNNVNTISNSLFVTNTASSPYHQSNVSTANKEQANLRRNSLCSWSSSVSSLSPNQLESSMSSSGSSSVQTSLRSAVTATNSAPSRLLTAVDSTLSAHDTVLTSSASRGSSHRLGSIRIPSGGLGLLLGTPEANSHLRCKVCNEPYQLQTSFMIQCQAQNWKLWVKWILGLAAMASIPFAVSAVFQSTTDPAPRVLSLAVLFLFEYALWRLAGFNLVTLYNYAKFSSFRIEGREIKLHRSSQRTTTTTTTTTSNRPTESDSVTINAVVFSTTHGGGAGENNVNPNGDAHVSTVTPIESQNQSQPEPDVVNVIVPQDPIESSSSLEKVSKDGHVQVS